MHIIHVKYNKSGKHLTETFMVESLLEFVKELEIFKSDVCLYNDQIIEIAQEA